MTNQPRAAKYPAPPALTPDALLPAMFKNCGARFAYMEGVGAEIRAKGGNTRRSPEYRAASEAYEAAVDLMGDVLLTYEPISPDVPERDAGEAVRRFKGRVRDAVREFSRSGMSPEEWVAHRAAERDARRAAADAAELGDTPAGDEPPAHTDH